MAGPSGRIYSNYDDFFNKLRDAQHRQGVSYTTDIYNMATTPLKLGFVPKTASSISDAIVLDTHSNPYIKGTNIVHIDQILKKQYLV